MRRYTERMEKLLSPTAFAFFSTNSTPTSMMQTMGEFLKAVGGTKEPQKFTDLKNVFLETKKKAPYELALGITFAKYTELAKILATRARGLAEDPIYNDLTTEQKLNYVNEIIKFLNELTIGNFSQDIIIDDFLERKAAFENTPGLLFELSFRDSDLHETYQYYKNTDPSKLTVDTMKFSKCKEFDMEIKQIENAKKALETQKRNENHLKATDLMSCFR